MNNHKQGEVTTAFMHYVSAFEQLDPRAIVSFYNEPALLISPQGVVSLPTRAHVEQFFGPLMVDLRSKGYSRSEFLRLAEHYLSDKLAIVSGIGIWKNTTGEQLRRFGLTYTLCRTPQSWRIVVAVIHDESSVLSF